MKRLLEALDVDYAQWRAVTRALRLFHFIDMGAMKAGIGAPIGFVLLFLLFGFTPGFIILRSHDPLLAGIAIATNCAFFSVMIIMTAYGGRLISADDYNFLGFRPVSSRTFLAIRVTAILFHALAVSAFASVVPLICLAVRTRAAAPVFAAIPTAALASITGGLALVAMYGWALQAASPEKVKRIVSYLQVVVGLGWLAGYLFAIRLIIDDLTIDVTLDRARWIWLYPGAWFGSYVAIAAGGHGAWQWAGAAASIACLAGLVAVVHGRMSLDYAERVAELAAGSSGPAGRQRSWRPRLFLSRETRAVALLLRAHFKSDMKFRLALLSFLPMMAVYWFMGMESQHPADPFLPDHSGGDSVIFIQMALLYLPDTLQRSLSTSETPLASWIFHATPAGKRRLVAASRNLVSACVLAPFLVALAAVFAYWFGNVRHALVHAFFLILMAHTVLMLAVFRDPRLPFSRPAEKQATGRFGSMMILMIAGSALYLLLTALIYRSAILMIAFAAALIAASVVLDRLTSKRIESRDQEWAG